MQSFQQEVQQQAEEEQQRSPSPGTDEWWQAREAPCGCCCRHMPPMASAGVLAEFLMDLMHLVGLSIAVLLPPLPTATPAANCCSASWLMS
jgi:hypothetical protein